ncbi:MAG TPA: RDD family protein [Azospira sp.]|nr:RDD family protein [Azospira sp.]
MTALLPTPGIFRRLAAMFYEILLATALLIFTLVVPHMLLGAFARVQAPPLALLTHLFVVLLVYCTWFWVNGGQTLAMKTWRIRVVDVGGGPLRPAQAVLRYMAAWVSIGCGGLGILWALFDRDGQFLHDRIADTRLVSA